MSLGSLIERIVGSVLEPHQVSRRILGLELGGESRSAPSGFAPRRKPGAPIGERRETQLADHPRRLARTNRHRCGYPPIGRRGIWADQPAPPADAPPARSDPCPSLMNNPAPKPKVIVNRAGDKPRASPLSGAGTESSWPSGSAVWPLGHIWPRPPSTPATF